MGKRVILLLSISVKHNAVKQFAGITSSPPFIELIEVSTRGKSAIYTKKSAFCPKLVDIFCQCDIFLITIHSLPDSFVSFVHEDGGL